MIKKPRDRKLIFFAVMAAIIAALIIATHSSFLAVFTYLLVAFLVVGGATAIALLGTTFICWAFDDGCQENTFNEVWDKMMNEIKTTFE
jgi:hypothetical protein